MNTRFFCEPVIVHKPTVVIYSDIGVHILTLDGYLRGGSRQEEFFAHATHAEVSRASLRELAKLKYTPTYRTLAHVNGGTVNYYLTHSAMQKVIALTVVD